MKNTNQFTGAVRLLILFLMFSFSGFTIIDNQVFAQDASSESEKTDAEDEFSLEEITVTGSRLRTTGMDTPTPVTVVQLDQIEVTSPAALIDGLAKLPQFFGSNTTQNTGGFFTTSGAGSLNLRGLQSKRTLQLLNSRRVVPSTIFGGPDINLFPETLLRSVETVTGGASAAYGTDAVAGVVNFILDTEYEGVKGHVQRGETELHNGENYELEIAGGYAITDQTRVLFSVEKAKQDPIYGDQLNKYDWYDSWGLVKNPSATAGTSRDNPFYIPANKLYTTTASPDGILLFPNPVGWYTIDGNNYGVPYVKGTLCTSNGHLCANNSSTSGVNTSLLNSDATQISPESGRENFFGYIEHNFNTQLKVYGQAMFGKTEWTNKNFGGVMTSGWGAFTVHRDNPFLPKNIYDLMVANNIENVKFGRVGSPDDIAFDPYTTQETKIMSLTTGFDYRIKSNSFFDDWQVKGYLQYGNTKVNAIQRGGVRLDRAYLAMDAVRDPLTGQPACNVTVTSRGTATPIYQDCVPINLFGAGNASEAAIDWVTGFEPGVEINANGFLSATESMPYSYISGENKKRKIDIDQTVFEVSTDGELYKGWGAGPIKMALGYNYREESFTQVVESGPGGNINADPTYRPVMANSTATVNTGLGIRDVPAGNFASGNSVEVQFSNVPFARGDQNVHEIFDELLVPIVSDLFLVKQLNYSGAVRWAGYSGAGTQWSWKNGLDWAVYKDLRFRGTISSDVRAATLGEKYDRTGGLGNVADYLLDSTGGISYQITQFSNGSPDIKPEKALTKTVGLVYQPGWLEGLNFSADWYTIKVKDNIQQMGVAEVVRRCYQNNDQQLCDLITRGGAAATDINGNPTTRITLVGNPYINQASVKATGIDFELGYFAPVDWFGGAESINWRLLGSYVGENSSTSAPNPTTGLTVKTETVGISYPKWTGVLSFGYHRGPWGFNMQHRYTGKTLIWRNWNYNGTGTRWDVYDNTVDAEILTDAQVDYRFDLDNGNLDLYFNVNNLFDRAPQPYLAGNAGGGDNASWFGEGPGLGVNPAGDLRGRRFVVGLKFEFK